MMVGVILIVVTVVLEVLVFVVAVVFVKEGPLHYSSGQLPNSLRVTYERIGSCTPCPKNGCPTIDLIALAVKWRFVEL